MGQKQHVDAFRKIALRRELLRYAVPGAAYVPFCGDGDIASQLYYQRPRLTKLWVCRAKKTVLNTRWRLRSIPHLATVVLLDGSSTSPYVSLILVRSSVHLVTLYIPVTAVKINERYD